MAETPRPDLPTTMHGMTCPRCGSTMQQRGEYHLPAPSNPEVGPGGITSFWRQRKTLMPSIPVVAMVCSQCGFLELYDDNVRRGGTPRVRY